MLASLNSDLVDITPENNTRPSQLEIRLVTTKPSTNDIGRKKSLFQNVAMSSGMKRNSKFNPMPMILPAKR